MRDLFTKTFFHQVLWFVVAIFIGFVLLVILAPHHDFVQESTAGAIVNKALSAVTEAFTK